MKNSNEIANDLVARRDVYKRQQRVKRNKAIKIVFSVSCCCFVAVLGISLWKNDLVSEKPPVEYDDKQGYVAEQEPSDNNEQQNKNGNYQEELNQDVWDDWKGDIVDSYEVGAEGCYSTPENNSYGISIPLKSAVKEHGDDARYMVIVDIFKDKELISENEDILNAELKRLEALGYNAFIEVNNSGAEPIYYFGMKISKQQLENFNMNEEYGYFFFIRSERIAEASADKDSYVEQPGNDSGLDSVYCGSYLDTSGKLVVLITEDTVDIRRDVCAKLGLTESSVTFKTAKYSLEYLEEVQGKISTAMAAKQLPFVISSALMEDLNRIVITVTTKDETELAKLDAFDRIGGAIEFEYTDTFPKNE